MLSLPAWSQGPRRLFALASATIILLVFLFIFSTDFITSTKLFGKFFPSLSPVANVEGQRISKEDFEKRLESQKYFYTNNSKLSEEEFAKLDERVKEELIQEVLLTNLLKKNGIVVTDDEVRQRIKELVVDRLFSGDWQKYEEELKTKYQTTLAQVERTARLDILKEKTGTLTDKKHVFAIWINKDELQLVSNEAMTQALRSQLESANRLKKQKAEEVLTRVTKEKNFTEIAKEYSEDPKSAQNGGDLGFLSISSDINLNPEKNEETFPGNAAVREALQLLDANNSKLYETFTGYAIIEVAEVKAGPLGGKSFEEWYPNYRNEAKVNLFK